MEKINGENLNSQLPTKSWIIDWSQNFNLLGNTDIVMFEVPNQIYIIITV
jgi:hypothetical protein